MIGSIFLRTVFWLASWLILFSGITVHAESPSSNSSKKTVSIYFFWAEGCSHCAEAKPFLNELQSRHQEVELKAFEIRNTPENINLLMQMGSFYGYEPNAVPSIFIGEHYFRGFNSTIAKEIEEAVEHCLKEGCEDKGASIFTDAPLSPIRTPASSPSPSFQQNQSTIYVPFVGKLDLDNYSLLASTVIIAFIDGLNPCSIWVLTVLLAIALHSGSRKKIIIIGLVFIFITGLVYAFFIAGIFTAFSMMSYFFWIQAAVSLTALFFGIINIKDYFWYKEGLSLTISDEKKPWIYKKMRKTIEAGESMSGLICGTIVLATGVSLIEFSCTAGLPILWSNLLISQETSTITFLFFLFLYMVIYQIEELIIFIVVVFSLKSVKIEEKFGRTLKLIGGMIMLTLASVMLFKPSMMNNLSSSLMAFGFAFAATILVLFLHRVALPKLGITIGSEFKE